LPKQTFYKQYYLSIDLSPGCMHQGANVGRGGYKGNY